MRSLPAHLSMVKQRNEFVRIDQLLARYYHQFGINTYVDKSTGNGIFLQYLIDNKLTNIDLIDYNASNNFKYTYFDPQFPLNNDTL
eukprot:UN06137